MPGQRLIDRLNAELAPHGLKVRRAGVPRDKAAKAKAEKTAQLLAFVHARKGMEGTGND